MHRGQLLLGLKKGVEKLIDCSKDALMDFVYHIVTAFVKEHPYQKAITKHTQYVRVHKSFCTINVEKGSNTKQEGGRLER